MKKKLLALLLATVMVIGLLAGCGSSTASSAGAEPGAASTAEEAGEAPAEEAPAAPEEAEAPAEPDSAAPEASAEEAGVAEEAAEEPEAPAIVISYPLDNLTEITCWKAMNNQFAQMISSYTDNHCLSYIEEQTGVKLNFIEPMDSASTTQFNLALASGDYPELIDCTTYTGGLGAAYNDGIINDLTDLIPEAAPDYWAAVQNSNDATIRALKDDEGRMYCIYTINNTYFVERGLEMRNDWLEAQNLAIPETTDELFEVLSALHDAYNTPYTFSVDSDGVMQYVIGAFGVSGFALDGNGIGCFVDADGKTIRSSLLEEGYRDYLDYFIKFYNADLIQADFYAQTPGPSTRSVTNQTALWFGMADAFASDKASALDESYDAIGIGAITMEKGQEYTFGDLPTMIGRANYSISSCADDVEAVLNYMNWFFTEDGYRVCNYGLEGEGYELNDAGEPVYTELITDNPDGWNKVNSKVVYAFWNIMPFYNAQDALLYTYSGRESESMETWTAVGYSQTLPSLSYLPDETAEYTTLVTDLSTYATEQILKFITGEDEYNDENWAEFEDNLYSMGIEDAIAITQTAYDRYLNR